MIQKRAAEILKRIEERISPDRLKGLGLITLVAAGLSCLAIAARLALDPGWVPDFGQDFEAFWIAARLGLEGRAADAFDPNLFGALQKEAFAHDDMLLWHYPAPWHALILPLGLLPYTAALLTFLAVSLAAWVAVAARYASPRDPLAFAAVTLWGGAWMCASQGQNGLLIGAALGAVFLGLRDNRPLLFTAATAFLLIKPHFSILIPVILIARGRWDLLLAATLASGAVLSATTLAVGWDHWQAFLGNTETLRMALGGGELSYQQASLFAALSLIGAPGPIAMAAQATLAALAILTTWRIWRDPASGWEVRGAVFLIATPLLSPYAFHYDLVALSLGLALLARDAARTGFLPGERLTAALLWFAPLYHWPLAKLATLPILPGLLILALAMIWRRYQACPRAARSTEERESRPRSATTPATLSQGEQTRRQRCQGQR